MRQRGGGLPSSRNDSARRLTATAFFAKFPGLDSFPDPGTLASPFTLRRADKNATVAVSDSWVIGSNKVNEIRAGVFVLDNSRRLDDPFSALTNAAVGVPNPATFFDDVQATQRLGHYIGAPGTIMERFSFGGPNDSYNQRQQRTWTLGDTLTWTRGTHAFKIGAEYRRNEFDTNLPEEQATARRARQYALHRTVSLHPLRPTLSPLPSFAGAY